jgi:predicted ATP-dependent endonuclease of OLD family
MFLQEVTIKNFKSITDLSIKVVDNVICLIGKNECGKSNILKALSYLNFKKNKFISELTSNRVPKKSTKFPSLKARFLITSLDLDFLKYTQENSLSIANGINSSVINLGLEIKGPELKDIEISLFADLKSKPLILNITGSPQTTKTHIEKLLDFIPNIEYFDKEEFSLKALNPTTLTNSPKDPSTISFRRLFELGGVENFSILSNGSPEEINELKEEVAEKINELLRKYYKQNEELRIKIDSHNGLYTLHFKDEFKKLNSLEDRSTGFQYFFSFLINKIYLKEFTGKNSIFLLDEPALVLHPTGQKDFIRLLDELAIDNQILYTTHSPFSINRLKPNRVFVIDKSEDRGTYINPKPHLYNWRALRTSLGIDMADSFFYADKTLLVEGPEERIYISSLLNFFSKNGLIELNTDIFSIVDAGGAANLPAMVQILLDESRPMLVLIDSDVKSEYKRIKKKELDLKNSSALKVIQVNELKPDALTIEDLLPIKIYEKAANSYIDYLLSEKVIRSKTQVVPSLTIKASGKVYEQIADHVLQNYEQIEGELNIKTPISKVGIANEFDKILKENSFEKTKDPIDFNISLELVKKIASYLKVFVAN